MPKVKLLFVHHRPELGGAPTSLSYLIAGLDPGRFEVHVYSPQGPAAELFAASGARVHVGPAAGFTHIWASTYKGRRWILLARDILRLPGHLRAFSRVLRSERFDIVHLNDSPLIAAAWLARRSGARIVWHLRAALPGDGTDVRSRLLIACVSRLADRVIAINEDVAASFHGVPALEVVFNSVDLVRFRPGDIHDAKVLVGLDADVPVVAFFGFLYPLKGYREFIEAAEVAVRRGVQARFLLIGGGVRDVHWFRSFKGRTLGMLGFVQDHALAASDLVEALGLDDVVTFIPYTTAPESWYRAADVVVAPARGPELGRQAIEAAACGRPVVATGSLGGAGIVVPGKTGLVVPYQGVDALAGAIVDLIADPARREEIGAAARLHAEAEFDPASNVQKVVAVYEDLLGSPRERPVGPRPVRGVSVSARPRVLYVHHRPQLGGAPLSLAYLIRELEDRYEPHVYCPPGPSADLLRRMGAQTHTGPTSIFVHVWDAYRGLRWSLFVRELLLLPMHVFRFRRVLRDVRPDLVHINDSPLLPAGILSHRFGARVVWHVRGALVDAGRDFRGRLIGRIIGRNADRVIAIDSDVAESFPLERSPVVIPNSADIGEPTPPPTPASRARFGLDPDLVTVGFFGYIRRQKGWPELVEAARILVTEGDPVQFAVMGGGVRPPAFFASVRGRLLAILGVVSNEEQDFHALVREQGLSDRFRFLPFTRDTASIYDALDVVVFPNQETGLGRPVIEAAAQGRPVVASGSEDGAEIVEPGITGILVPRGDPPALAAALRTLVHDESLRLRMGRAAHEFARERFDPKRNAEAVAAIYAEVLGTSLPHEAIVTEQPR